MLLVLCLGHKLVLVASGLSKTNMETCTPMCKFMFLQNKIHIPPEKNYSEISLLGEHLLPFEGFQFEPDLNLRITCMCQTSCHYQTQQHEQGSF